MVSKAIDTQKSFNDIYLTYDAQFEVKVLRLYHILVDRYDLKVWLDIMELKSGDDKFKKTTEAITNSRIMMCCVTKSFPSTSKCKSDVTLGYTNDKLIFLLMVENLSIYELQPIQFAIQNAQKFNLFETANPSQVFHGELFTQVLQAIENAVEKKLFNRKNKKTLKAVIANDGDAKIDRRVKFPTIAFSIATHQIENNMLRVTTITTEEILIDKTSVYYKAYDEEQQQLQNPSISRLNLKLFKSTSLLTSVCGFNRMVLLESKGKYLITSSYNQSIVIADRQGNWLERRNPSGVLRQPWGICTSKTEVFIGDNDSKCILVFDMHLKFVRKIGENVADGLFDLAYDEPTNEIFIADLYNSRLYVVDALHGRLRRKAFIPSPTYLRVVKEQLFILSTDYIFCMNKLTFEVVQTIKLPSSDCMFGLYVDAKLNIYTTAHGVDEDYKKTKDVFLYVVRSADRHVLKKIPVKLTQVNDMSIHDGRMTFLSDTHIDIFDYAGLPTEIPTK